MKKVFLKNLFPVFIIFLSCSGFRKADLILYNANIITVDADFSIQQAAAVRAGRIMAVGLNEDILTLAGENTRKMDMSGLTVLPGLIDAHGHLLSLGTALSTLNITGTESFEEIISLVKERVKTARPGEWITGGRWDQNSWPVKEFPVHDALSALSPANPVYLTRADGNSAFVNAAALEIAGIDINTPDPPGGRIIRKWNGQPSGVLINQAMNLVKNHIPLDGPEEFKDKFEAAARACLKAGLTGVHEAGVSPQEILLIKQLADEDRLYLRVDLMLGEQAQPVFAEDDLESFFRKQRFDSYGEDILSMLTIKLFFDGALGSRGAAFFEDYSDDPGNNGLLRITPEYITRVSRAALKNRMNVAVHAIGTRGNKLCLDAYITALSEFPGRDHRFRIEHAQIVRGQDIQAFAEWNIIPSMQPIHCTSDMRFAEDRVGKERLKGAYAWRRFLDAGLVIPCGSDFPVEPVSPFKGIYAAVTRQDAAGNPPGGWYADQRMTREEAIKGFTIWAAYAAFQEKNRGSIEKGKWADLTVIDTDIFTCEPADILNARVIHTVTGGRIRYSAGQK